MSIACVFVPSFELQAMAQRRHTWRTLPAAIVAGKRRPQIHQQNKAALSRGVQKGMSLRQAQALSPGLQWSPWLASHQKQAVAALGQVLERFSPSVFVLPEQPGCFWCDCRGMVPLFDSIWAWGQAVMAALQSCGWSARLGIAANPFDAMVQARTTDQPGALHALGLDTTTQQKCLALGITSMDQLASIPAEQRIRALGRQTALGRQWCQQVWRHRVACVAPEETMRWRWSAENAIEHQDVLVRVLQRGFEQLSQQARRVVLRPVRCTWKGSPVMGQREEVLCVSVPGTGGQWRDWRRLIALQLQHTPWQPVMDITLEMACSTSRPVQGVLPLAQQERLRASSRSQQARLSEALLECQSRFGAQAVQRLMVKADVLLEQRHQVQPWRASSLQVGAGHNPVRVRVCCPNRIISTNQRMDMTYRATEPWWLGGAVRQYGLIGRVHQDRQWGYVSSGECAWHQIGWG